MDRIVGLSSTTKNYVGGGYHIEPSSNNWILKIQRLKVGCFFIMIICAATVKGSLSATIRASENGLSLVSEESIPVVSKKERLSRQERAAVVESFVQKYVENVYLICYFSFLLLVR